MTLLEVENSQSTPVGMEVLVTGDKLPLVPERIMERRARFRALASTGFASTGNDDEDLADTLQLTEVRDVKKDGNSRRYTILVSTPF